MHRHETIELRFSATEVLRHKDFADYTDSELDEAQLLMSRLRLVGSPRRSLRLAAADRRTPRPDLRRTVRAAMHAYPQRCSGSCDLRACSHKLFLEGSKR